MPITKIDGQRFIESGSVIVSGDAVVELRVEYRSHVQQIAIKFRSEGSQPQIRYGNPRPDRTVVHFANMPMDTVSSGGGVGIGKIVDDDLWLAFVIEPFPNSPGDVRHLTYTLYATKASE